MSEEVSLGEALKEIRDVYQEFCELLEGRPRYSPAQLIQRFNQDYQGSNLWCRLSDAAKASYIKSVEQMSNFLNFCGERARYIMVAFDALKDAECKLDGKKLGSVIGLLTSLLDAVTERVINGWLVEKAREMGSVSAENFDLYNELKERWNSLLRELEMRLRRLGVEVYIKARAKELGVVARK